MFSESAVKLTEAATLISLLTTQKNKRMSTTNNGKVGLPMHTQTRQKLFNFKKTRIGGLIGVFLLSAILAISSCTKEAVQESDKDILEIKQNIIYKGVTYNLTGSLDIKNNKLEYTNFPDELREFKTESDDKAIQTVTHVIQYPEKTDIYLFDSKEEYNEVFTYEANQNKLKGQNQAQIKTYDQLSVVTGLAIAHGTLFRTMTNPFWSKRNFGQTWAYADGIGWVGATENDRIDAIQFSDFTPSWTSERVHFVATNDANWGGPILRVTLASGTTSANPKSGTAPIQSYPYFSGGWLPWGNWGNTISCYEMFQANVWMSGAKVI
jgi:hypothetical protein